MATYQKDCHTLADLLQIDKRICTWACLMFFALQLDRGNISQALSDNMLDDLNINTNDYNYGQTIFYLCFLCAELPSQLISKKLGPDNWIPIQMVSWSLVASLQAFLSGRSSFFACRALLGLIEGGFIPDNILYLSYFYTGWELPGRLSWFWVSYQSTSIVSAFLAFGILRLRGHNGMEGWRWLFALEGMLTGLIGIASWFYLPPSPTQTASKTWNPFRGKDGWFNEREEKIMVNRILRDDPSKGDMHNRQGLSFRMLWECIKDYHMWPIYLIGLSWTIPSTPSTAYLTLQLRSLGFGTFETNLLTVSTKTGRMSDGTDIYRSRHTYSSSYSSCHGHTYPNASTNAFLSVSFLKSGPFRSSSPSKCSLQTYLHGHAGYFQPSSSVTHMSTLSSLQLLHVTLAQSGPVPWPVRCTT